MTGNTEAQAAALRLLWPEIGAYCGRYGISQHRLLTGLGGVPVDSRKLVKRCEGMLLTRYDLADQAGVTYDTITKIINGQRNPSAAVFSQLIRILECDPSDLFLETEPVIDPVKEETDESDRRPPSMLDSVTFDDSLDDRAKIVKMRPVNEDEDVW